MKKLMRLFLLLSFFCVFLFSGTVLEVKAEEEEVIIDETTFPDENFRQYVLERIDTDGNGVLELLEIIAVSNITASEEEIMSLQGVEYFTELTYLFCNGNQLSSLDISRNTKLRYLYCYNNQLSDLDVSQNTALRELHCYNNQLSDLDVSQNTALEVLACHYNQLSNLDISQNTALRELKCHHNQLGSLDVSRNTALERLECDSNQLRSLDVSQNAVLKSLYCSSNQLSSLDVSQNSKLTTLSCSNNQSIICPTEKLTDLPGFDPAKTNNWTGATYDTQSDMLKEITSDTVTYTYACGKGNNQLKFALTVSHYDNNEDNKCDVCMAQMELVIDETTFPDESFRQYVLDNFDTDMDGKLTFEESTAVQSIDVSGYGIESLTGIECFTALTSLNCSYNQLSDLDVSQNTVLESLLCYENQLDSLNVSRNTLLERLICNNNQLSSLDVSQITSLDILDCSNNRLSSLDVSQNIALLELDCSYNQISILNVSRNPALEELDCSYNQLSTLIVRGNPVLETLKCSNNQLSDLDVSSNTVLHTLFCSNNRLSILDVSSNTALMSLNCAENQLKGMDVSRNTKLTRFDCINNSSRICPASQLTELSGLDFAKITDIGGAVYDAESGILTVQGHIIKYYYDCGKGYKKMFQITVSHCDENEDGQCDECTAQVRFPIDEATFPDVNFRQLVLDNIDTDKNGVLEFEESNAVVKLDVQQREITSLKGIECFSVLVQLNCSWNQLSSLDLSQNKICSILYCHNNQLSSLKFSPSLYYLMGSKNQLSSLDVSRNIELYYLECSNNQLTSLDVSKSTALEYLQCGNNQLTSLDVSKNTALTFLNCTNNQLSSLDVSRNTALDTLGCHDNPLGSLDVSRNTALTHLSCDNNQLSSLDVSRNTALTHLSCDNNQLSSLDVSRNTALGTLRCSDNPLGSLDISRNTALGGLACNNNQLSSLDVSRNTALGYIYCNNNRLSSLDISGNTELTFLECNNNRLSSLDVSQNLGMNILRCNDNKVSICQNEKLTDLPGFDSAKASNWNGAVYDAESGRLTAVTSENVSYDYDCGNGYAVTFTLEILEHADEDGDGFCEICGGAYNSEPTPEPTPEPETAEDFVSRLYEVVLGREADEASLAAWTGYLESGEYTGAEVAQGFIMSKEFLNTPMTNEEFVKILYSAFFGRTAAENEVAAWADYLNQGYRKSFVFSGFANSVEFGNLCEGYGVEAGSVPVTVSEQQPGLSDEEYNVWLFVERMYTEVLKRTPDMGGIKGWVDLLKAGTWTGAQVAEGFILSEEFLATPMTNETYVKIMYKAFFGREADSEGLAGWVNALETGSSKEFVFAGFTNSNEFGVLCESYGITQGSVPTPEPTPQPTAGKETPYEFFSGDYITTEDTTVMVGDLTVILDTNVYVPGHLEDVLKTGMETMEQVSGLTFAGNPETQVGYEHDVFELVVTRENLYAGRDWYTGLDTNEFGAAYAGGYEACVSPGDLLLGNSYTVMHELGHVLMFRQCRWAYCQLLNEGFTQYTTQLALTEMMKNSPEEAYYFERLVQNTTDVRMWENGYEELYKYPAEHWFENTFEYATNGNYAVGFRFMAYLHDVYGEYSSWITEFERIYPFRESGLNHNSSSVEQQIDVLKQTYGENVLDNFYPWLREHEEDFEVDYSAVTDRCGAQKINLYPEYNAFEQKMELVHMQYSGLYINLEPARMYLKEYKKADVTNLSLVTDVPVIVNLYRADGVYTQVVTDEPVSLNGISYIKLVGEGNFGKLQVIGFSDIQ